jgi:hypothetical protein
MDNLATAQETLHALGVPREYNPPTISFDLMEMIGIQVVAKREADKILDNYNKVLCELYSAYLCTAMPDIQYFNEMPPADDEQWDFWCSEYEKQDNQLFNSLDKKRGEAWLNHKRHPDDD